MLSDFMDRRKLKKHIQYLALMRLNQMPYSQVEYELGLILDSEPSKAQILRFQILLEEMLANVESKLD